MLRQNSLAAFRERIKIASMITKVQIHVQNRHFNAQDIGQSYLDGILICTYSIHSRRYHLLLTQNPLQMQLPQYTIPNASSNTEDISITCTFTITTSM